MSDPLPITVYSDVICPWCYVGKRRLEAALGRPGHARAHQRSPGARSSSTRTCPPRASSARATALRKFGEARSAELDLQDGETGRELGIAFAFDRMQRTPNTRLAHRLIWEAGRQGRQDAIVERLFHGYFEEGARHRRGRYPAQSRRPNAGWTRRAWSGLDWRGQPAKP